MAELVETLNALIEPGQVVDLRSAFGITLDDGEYSLSNAGPGNVFVAVALAEGSLPAVGHPLIANTASQPFGLEAGPGTVFAWLKGPYAATLVISPPV